MTDRKAFLARLAAGFYPALRASGFKGSGSTLRRQVGPILSVVNVQGSAGARCCYLNLGVHLDFLMHPTGKLIDPRAILEYQCAFRTRVERPHGWYGWPYGDTEEETSASIAGLRSAFDVQGSAFFKTLAVFPKSFVVKPDDLRREGRPELVAWGMGAMTSALIAVHLGDRDRAFIEIGLEQAPPTATSCTTDVSVHGLGTLENKGFPGQ